MKNAIMSDCKDPETDQKKIVFADSIQSKPNEARKIKFSA